MVHTAGSRLAAPTTAVVVGGLTALLLAAEVPLSERAHQGVLSNVANLFPLAFLIVGVLVARSRPRNPIGWILLAAAVLSVLQGAAALYSSSTIAVTADCREARSPCSWSPRGQPAIVLFAVAIQLFPDGHLAMRRGRWFLWVFGAVAAAWMVGAYALAATHVIENSIHVTSSGDLVQVDNPTGSAAWSGYVQMVFFRSSA